MNDRFTYDRSIASPKFLLRVFCDKKRVGSILQETDGDYFYVPLGSPKFRGETMQTLAAVKQSIEAE